MIEKRTAYPVGYAFLLCILNCKDFCLKTHSCLPKTYQKIFLVLELIYTELEHSIKFGDS